MITHSSTIYRTTALVDRLQRLRIPYEILLPEQTSMEMRGREFYLFHRGRRLRPAVVLNGVYKRLGQGLEYVEALEAMGVPVINSAVAWRQAKAKPVMSAVLASAGIPHPFTAFSQRSATLSHWISGLDGLLVAKPWRGSAGGGIVRGRAKAIASRLRRPRHRLKQGYMQEYVSNPGRDIRVVVVGGDAIGATYRIAPRGKWKTNVAAGGQPAYCEVTEELGTLAIRATQAFHLDVSGVDIIEGPDGYVVLEINAWPNYQIFDEVARVDVAGAIAALIARRLKEAN